MSTNYPKYDKFAQYGKKKKPSRYERIVTFLINAKRIVKVARKPSRKEYWLIFKICGVGLIILGVLSYIIQLVFSVALPIGK
jgi:protein transport protein SEC61 subunit gamma-like protein